jgi:uncharacterized damage-inducible protein DinB
MTEAADLAFKLKAEGEKLVGFFSSLTASQWEVEVYTEAAVWTTRNTLAHLMTAERAFVRLFEQIRQGGQGVSEDFVIDRYNASQHKKTAELSPYHLLERYVAVRQEMVAWVSGLGDSDLDRRGRHPHLGVTTLREMIKMIYIHNQVHYRDIRRALKD